MSEASAKIQLMRDQQLTRGIRAAAVVGLLMLICSLIRAWIVGWHDVMYLHVLVYLVILATAILDRYLSFSFRAFVFLGVSFIMGAASLLTWGFGAFSLPALFFFCILSTVFLGPRAGTIACIVSIGMVGIVGACIYAGILSFDYDAKIHLNSPITWLVVMLETGSFAGVLVVVLGTLNRQVEQLAQILEKQNTELVKKNRDLQREIADRIQAEKEQQRLSSRLKTALKMEALGTLAGGVAHDLNNVLGGIIGHPDLLLEKLPEKSTLRETIEAIKKSGLKAAAIVNDMLTLSRRRLESAEVINLNSVIADYCASPEFAMLKRYHPQCEIVVETDPALKNIQGSPFHLSKVLMNLVSNAAEAMPEGGRITISSEERQVQDGEGRYEAVKPGDYAVLRVQDSGIGIPPADIERIFEPFYSKKKLGRSGTGLGMAVVWGSVKDHGGYIDVHSIEGKGTTFTLYFPATTLQAAPAAPPLPRTSMRGNGESILVVDDVPEQREIASRILTEIGYSVRTCASGEEAVDHLKSASADLLILDMLMEPGINGLETYKRIAELHPGQKAIIATGFAETAQIREAFDAGVGRCIKKPYLIDEIAHAVKAELEKEAQPQSQGVS